MTKQSIKKTIALSLTVIMLTAVCAFSAIMIINHFNINKNDTPLSSAPNNEDLVIKTENTEKANIKVLNTTYSSNSENKYLQRRLIATVLPVEASQAVVWHMYWTEDTTENIDNCVQLIATEESNIVDIRCTAKFNTPIKIIVTALKFANITAAATVIYDGPAVRYALEPLQTEGVEQDLNGMFTLKKGEAPNNRYEFIFYGYDYFDNITSFVEYNIIDITGEGAFYTKEGTLVQLGDINHEQFFYYDFSQRELGKFYLMPFKTFEEGYVLINNKPQFFSRWENDSPGFYNIEVKEVKTNKNVIIKIRIDGMLPNSLNINNDNILF